jgi:hypothetical protein
MTVHRSLVLWLVLVLPGGKSLAQEASAKQRSKVEVPKIAMPALGEIPKAEGVTAPAVDKLAAEPTVPSVSATYEIAKVQHAKSFVRTRAGLLAMGGAIDTVNLAGKPPATEKFSTVIRVKSPQKLNTSIEVEILDPRGETAMSSAGQLHFPRTKSDEAEYVIDWASVPCRFSGDFQVVVRVAGQRMGTWPLRVVETRELKPVESKT